MAGTSRKRKLDKDEADSKVLARYGFIREESKLVCMICETTLNDTGEHTMFNHLRTNHPLMKGKSLDVFMQKQKELKVSRGRYQERCFKAEYLIAWHIAQNSKPYTIVDDFLIPCWVDVLPALNVKLSNYSTRISCPENIVSLRINELANDIYGQIMDNVRESVFFTIQLDYVNIFSKPLVFVFVRYIYHEDVVENLILCKPSANKELVVSAIAKDLEEEGQKCMMDCVTGFVSDESKLFKLPSLINDIMSETASPILSKAEKILEDITRQNSNLQSPAIFCTKTECRFHEISGRPVICANIMIGLCKHKMNTARDTERTSLKQIAYLADLYAKLNSMCFSLQVNSTNLAEFLIKISIYLQELEGIIQSIITRNYQEFPTLWSLLRFDNSTFRDEKLENSMITAIKKVKDIIRSLKFSEVPGWVINPFDYRAWQDTIETPLQAELLQLSREVELEREFRHKTISQFWISLKNRFPELFRHAIPFLIRSPTNSFRTLKRAELDEILTNFRERFDFSNDLIIRFSSPLKPNIDRLVDELQKKEVLFQKSPRFELLVGQT